MEKTTPQFSGILQDALALPEQERQRLAQGMAELYLLPAAPSQPPQEILLARTAEDVSAWLQEISGHTPWDQLQLIDEALLDVEEEGEEAAALKTARARLLDDHPPVAVRGAIVSAASQHPIGTFFGVAGLLLALYGVGRAALGIFF